MWIITLIILALKAVVIGTILAIILYFIMKREAREYKSGSDKSNKEVIVPEQPKQYIIDGNPSNKL